MKKTRVLVLVCVFILSFTSVGFAAEGIMVEPEIEQALPEQEKRTEMVKDYEVIHYVLDRLGGYVPESTQVYYKEITFENGYEIADVQHEVVREGYNTDLFYVMKYNYRTY
ncbi:hypothetical protein KQI42_15560 [Tissierella sp. MSJ-40]|uniref:Uncharacterized protein n=1 Tax=Tissierella simiarum TaxID=2841534 RepID=A0ABS6EB62_9FIRM|nr:hypothetical protein [Tissierella simiarum]MBU5439434.1 hypothetical protein [Tissierella simiarum]